MIKIRVLIFVGISFTLITIFQLLVVEEKLAKSLTLCYEKTNNLLTNSENTTLNAALKNDADPFQVHLDISDIDEIRCPPTLDILFFIHTAPDHFTHREVLRNTLGSAPLAEFFNYKLIFFVGISKRTDVNMRVLDESAKHKDTVILPFLDSYMNLTYKFINGARWVTVNCRQAKTVVKMDDDIFVNVFRLGEYIRDNVSSADRAFHCRFWITAPVARSTNSPWFVSRKKYPSDYYPPYCSGAAVIMRTELLDDVYRASFLIPFVSIDDAYVTGDLAVVARIGHRSLKSLITYNSKQILDVVHGKLIFLHAPGVENLGMRMKMWEEMLRRYNVSIGTTPDVLKNGDVMS